MRDVQGGALQLLLSTLCAHLPFGLLNQIKSINSKEKRTALVRNKYSLWRLH